MKLLLLLSSWSFLRKSLSVSNRVFKIVLLDTLSGKKPRLGLVEGKFSKKCLKLVTFSRLNLFLR